MNATDMGESETDAGHMTPSDADLPDAGGDRDAGMQGPQPDATLNADAAAPADVGADSRVLPTPDAVPPAPDANTPAPDANTPSDAMVPVQDA